MNKLRKQLYRIQTLMEQYRIPPEFEDHDFMTQDDYHSLHFEIAADDDFSKIPKDVTLLVITGTGDQDLSILCDFPRLEVVNLSKANVNIPDCLIQKDKMGELLLIT